MTTMNKRRLTCLFLALMTLASVSCGEGSDSPDVTTSSDSAGNMTEVETADTRFIPDVEARNFGGKELRIYSFDCANIHFTVVPENETGDTINDALYKRNSVIEDKYGVELTESFYSWGGISNARSVLVAGDDSYDLVSINCPNALVWYREGLVIPYDELPNVNFEKGYWDSPINDSLSLDGVNYIAEGAYNLDIYDLTFCLLVNKPLCEQFGIKDIYSDVSGGKWTFDLMKEYMTLVTADINGDTKMDMNDRYGYTAHPKMVAPGFWIGADELSITKDEKDHPEINLTSNRFVEVFDKIFNVVHDSGASYLTDGDNLDIPTECRKMFAENRSLFVDMSFFYIEVMRSVDTEFGIIPYPKFDEDQGEYHSRVCYYFPTIVPITCKDTDFVGYMLEIMNYESYKTVIPSYYDVALKTKGTRDEESADMLDLIFASRRIDIGDSTLCDVIRDKFIYEMMKDDSRDLISTVERNRPRIEERLEQ